MVSAMNSNKSNDANRSIANKPQATRVLLGALAIILSGAADGSWLKHVPAADRRRVNPYLGQAEAVAAGGRLFSAHCAQCHGADALGNPKHPSLRSYRVQQATDGEVFWLLTNGNLSRGMPTWASLPDESRWQIIAYVKSLGPSSSHNASREKQSQ
jgi:mono/diheme cytochrome c family protein